MSDEEYSEPVPMPGDYERPPPGLFPVCEKCGVEHARQHRSGGQELLGDWLPTCAAHKKIWVDKHGRPARGSQSDKVKDGLRFVGFRACRAFPIPGLHLCRNHGGNLPSLEGQKEANLARRKYDKQMMLALQEVDDTFKQQHPIEGLLEEVGRSAQLVHWLAGEVAQLHFNNDVSDQQLQDLTGFDSEGNPIVATNRYKLLGTDHQGNLQFHPLYQELTRERMNHAKLCAMALAAGVQQQMVNLATAQAMHVARIVNAAIESVGLEREMAYELKRTVAAMLRTGSSIAPSTPSRRPAGLPPAQN